MSELPEKRIQVVSEVKEVKEICRWGIASDCLRHGAKELFVGRTCQPCVIEKRRRYYIDNRDSILLQNKIRQKQNYKSKRKMILEQKLKELNEQ